ncbi:hypothetical protein VTG60DRAFT_5279 [Thermothelomyces hinnuleus]
MFALNVILTSNDDRMPEISPQSEETERDPSHLGEYRQISATCTILGRPRFLRAEFASCSHVYDWPEIN